MKAIQVLSVAAFAVGSLFLSSCGCCTGEEPVPPLRPVPQMKALPGATAAPEMPVLGDK